MVATHYIPEYAAIVAAADALRNDTGKRSYCEHIVLPFAFCSVLSAMVEAAPWEPSCRYCFNVLACSFVWHTQPV